MNQEKLAKIREINKKCTFLYYLENNKRFGKCVILITDNQLVFLPAIPGFAKDHTLLNNDLQIAIGHDPKIPYDEAIYITATRNELTFQFPIDEQLSPTQITLTNHILDDINKYNLLVRRKEAFYLPLEVKIKFLTSDVNTSNLQEYMLNHISLNKVPRTEIIIGETANSFEKNDIKRKITNKYLSYNKYSKY